jgi:hypothetical protein
VIDRAQVQIQHQTLDLSGARQRALSVRPLRDVIDVTPIEPKALPAVAGSVPVPIEGAARVEAEPIEADIDPFQ